MARRYPNTVFVLSTTYTAIVPNKDFTGFDEITETVDGYLTEEKLQKQLDKKYGRARITYHKPEGVMYGFTAAELVSIGHPVHPKTRQPWKGESEEEKKALNEAYRLSLKRFQNESEDTAEDEEEA